MPDRPAAAPAPSPRPARTPAAAGRELWGTVALMLWGAFELGRWTRGFDLPGATPWGLAGALRLAGGVLMVGCGLLALRRLARGRARGAGAGAPAR